MRRFLADQQFSVLNNSVQTDCVAKGQINKLDNMHIESMETVEVTKMGDYDSVKMFITATSIDYTIDERTGELANQAELGDGKTPSTFSEYWTFMRKSGRRPERGRRLRAFGGADEGSAVRAGPRSPVAAAAARGCAKLARSPSPRSPMPPSTVTVVIPALNEAERLPLLLDSLSRQTQRPDQIVIADAGSTDATRLIAERRGAQVVDGGKPAAGRNAGAAVATGDLILFLDADDQLDDEFIAGAIEEFTDRDLAVATAFVDPIERDPQNIFACEVVNLYLDVMQYVAPHAPGFCILVRRDVHNAIGGFDETVVLAEDHDYVQRAAEKGRFRVLRCFRVGTSMRRIEKEGLVRLAFKYLYCEMYVVAGRPIREVPFDYEFAAFESSGQPEARSAVEALRERIGELADAALGASADGLRALRELGSSDVSPQTFDRTLRELAGDDIGRLARYVEARARLARRAPKKVMERVRAAGGAIWRGLAGEE